MTVDAIPLVKPEPLRRRLIVEADIPVLPSLLARAFPHRDEASWRLGLERLGRRQPPDGLPRYGVLLQAGDRIVGAVLTICATVEEGGSPALRCHLSSWFMEPAFAPHAGLLIGPLLRRPETTLVNVTPAAHTEATIEQQGFRTFCRGSAMVLPLVAGATARGGAVRSHLIRSGAVRALEVDDASNFLERDLFATHLAWGCCGFVVDGDGGALPFIFSPPRRLRGILPASRLLYCRDLTEFTAHAGALGRALLRRGVLAVIIDAAAVPGLRARRIGGTQGRYWRGSHPPRPGDLAYCEHALFGD